MGFAIHTRGPYVHIARESDSIFSTSIRIMNRIELTKVQSTLLANEWKAYFLSGDYGDPRLPFLAYCSAAGVDLQWGTTSELCTIPADQYVFFLLRYCT